MKSHYGKFSKSPTVSQSFRHWICRGFPHGSHLCRKRGKYQRSQWHLYASKTFLKSFAFFVEFMPKWKVLISVWSIEDSFKS